jgi:hypothetical protein
MEKHTIHRKIGIKQKGNRLFYVCSLCGACLAVDDVFYSLDRDKNLEVDSIEYWRKLRHEMDKMRIQKRRGVNFEGIFLPDTTLKA